MLRLVRAILIGVAAAATGVAGCAGDDLATPAVLAGDPADAALSVLQPAVGLQRRMGDEIVVAGHFYRIGTPVVTWMDAGGYDAYRTSRHFQSYGDAGYLQTQEARLASTPRTAVFGMMDSPNRYGTRYADATTRAVASAVTRPRFVADAYARATTMPLTDEQFEQVRNGGWSLELLQEKVDQFVLHYDVAGTSASCFRILHDDRNLSVHFLLDLDGTIYQTIDLKERASHATKSNDRSIGIEIANIGSYDVKSESQAPLVAWYKKDAQGLTYLSIPADRGGLDSQRTRPSVLRPMRNEPIVGVVQGREQRMYDLTPQQYAALIKLTAALGDVFPRIRLDYPRDASGRLAPSVLDDAAWGDFAGLIGHYHVQPEKSDPGVAFQWDHVIEHARTLLAARRAAVAK